MTISNASDLDIEYKGNIGIDYKKFDYSTPYAKDKNQKTILGEVELTKSYEDIILFSKIEALDEVDKNDGNSRDYIKLNEFYIKYESDNYDIKVGRDIKYWGALELYNITDIYNEKNTKNDPYDKDKKFGRDGVTYNYYFENEDSLSFIVSKNKNAKYDTSSYIKYSGSRDDIASRDFTYILSSLDEKFMMYHTIIIEDTIYKVEYLYSNKTEKYQGGVGLEHTLYSIFDKKDLGLMVEYYKSNAKSNDTNRQYTKNIFVGSRLTFNNINSTEMVFGVIKDDTKKEYSKSIELNSRFYDDYKIKLGYLKNDSLAVYSINIAYYF